MKIKNLLQFYPFLFIRTPFSWLLKSPPGKLHPNTCPHSCYNVLFTRNECVHKPSTPAIDKGVNALNLVLQTLPMFSKSTWSHLLTQPQSKYLLQNSPSEQPSYSFLGNFHYLVFQKGNKQVRRQVFLRGSKFFEILFFPQYIVRSNHRKVLYEITVLHLW